MTQPCEMVKQGKTDLESQGKKTKEEMEGGGGSLSDCNPPPHTGD